MDAPVYVPDYVYKEPPPPGQTLEVAPGVFWVRMPLPFKLDHINLWLLDDGDGWTIVDTGISRDEVKAAWEAVFARHVTPAKPLKRLICTHFHPDHFGLAGWLTERFDVPLWMPREEWTWGRMLSLDAGEGLRPQFLKFYKDAGFDRAMLETAAGRAGRYAKNVAPVPAAFRRIVAGDHIEIGGRRWFVIVGNGHSPEHACLYCAEAEVLISGDQVLPKISPNVSVWPQEPEADPLGQYLASIKRLSGLPEETLVLPSHMFPFRGLEGRIDDLGQHHAARLDETLAAVEKPATGVEVLRKLFTRELDTHQLFFAIGESLAHLHRLMAAGLVGRQRGGDGAHVYRRL
jgi:glyoxylase-like metal-dependent hydrolase (beta-lactamase superfamily II)